MTSTDHAELLRRCITCATDAHAGQDDKSGVPYIYHPLRVMLAVWHLGVEYACCAVLHDVVEDTPITLEYLERHLRIPIDIINAVDAISQRPGESMPQYLDRCVANPIALECKIADVRDNMGRLDYLPQSARERLARKYAERIEFLLSRRDEA